MKTPQFITRASGKTKLALGNNGPTILTIAGVAGMVVSNVLTARATLKAEKRLPEIKEDILAAKVISTDLHEDDTKSAKRLTKAYMDATVELAKIYWPSIVVFTASGLCILSAHKIMLKRNASLVAAYSALDVAYRAYRKRVADEIGADRERALYQGVKVKEGTGVDGVPCEYDMDDIMPSPYARFFDEYCKNWTKTPEYNLMFLRSQQQWANDRLHAYGYLFLNEVYEALGLERTQAGQVVGWKLGEGGDGFVDFGLFNIGDESSRAFVNMLEPCVLLDFNVDGPIRI